MNGKAMPTKPNAIGRNDPCPCGSGKKYKQCCLGRQQPPAASPRPDAAAVPGTIPDMLQTAVGLHQAGRLQDADALYRQILQQQPQHPDALHLSGLIAHQSGRHQQALELIGKAIEIRPSAVMYCNLGLAFDALGKRDQAITSFRQALVLQPDHADAYINLGATLKDQGKLDEAIESYGQALALRPDFAEAHYNLGVALTAQGRLEEAVQSYRNAVALNPQIVRAHVNLGDTLKDLGLLDESIANSRRALQIRPDYTEAFDNLLFTLNYHPDKSAEEIFAAYREYDRQFGLPQRAQWRGHANSTEMNRRLKIGYVSRDFNKHSVRHFLEPQLAHHDKSVVEVYAYAELKQEDDVTRRYQACVEHWIPTVGLSDDALAERIRADGIDILVDLAGHTAHNRLGVFARKPAPVSLTCLGYGYTTGLSAIDYILIDQISAPAGSEALFSETPWRLDGPHFTYRPAEAMGEVSPLPAIRNGRITFGTLTRAVRINHRTVRVWSEILRQVPGSTLLIDSRNFRDAALRDRLQARFAAHGIGAERLQIGFHTPPWDLLRSFDIGLDCFPHNSGTTLFETLYMGLPYVTLAGRASVGLLGSTILESVGHPEWIARTEDDYIAKAVALAADVPKLAKIRAGLRAEMMASALMDEAGFVRKLETAYREMFGKWVQQLA